MATKSPPRVRRNPLYVELQDPFKEMLDALMVDEKPRGMITNQSDMIRQLIRSEFRRRKLKQEGR